MADVLPAAAEPLALQFKINNSMVHRGLDGLSDDQVWQQLNGQGNPIAWIVGHLTETRGQMLGLLGAPWDAGWSGMFKRGSALYDRFAYPTRADLEARFKETHARMRDAFAMLTAERLAAAAPVSFAGARTLAELLAFFAFHEAYHLGQVGYIRRHLGHSSLAG